MRKPERSSMRWALSVAVDNRRYEWSASVMNEQIFDLTGGKKKA